MMEYKVVYSKRKTIGITVEKDCSVTVHCPNHTPKLLIEKAVNDNEKWIESHIIKRSEYNALHPPLSDNEVKLLIEKAKSIIPQRVNYYSKIMDVTPIRITITGAKTRFGSCSGKNAISFSYLLMQYPNEAIDYVVVHELAHIKHHNHSKDFYAFVESVLPDYKEREKLLKK